MNRLLRAGDRIRLVAMTNDPDPMPTGETGTVASVHRHGEGREAWFQVDVSWDNGRTLMLVSPPDKFEIIAGAK